MAITRNREEVINTQLAVLISNLGVSADAETLHVRGEQRPDVLFYPRGLRAVIEAKLRDAQNAEKDVLQDARKRVRDGLAHIAAAVIYPIPLRTTPTARLLDVLKESQLKYRIVTETHESDDWYEGPPASLMDAMRRAHETLTKDDLVEKTARALNDRLQAVAPLWIGQKGACDRLSVILGLNPPKGEETDKALQRRETAAKVSALVLANAFIFQEQLARSDARIGPLRKFEAEPDLISRVSEHWRWIWQEINYVPIFQLGDRVLNELPSGPQSSQPVKALLIEAKNICTHQAALRHDLMGRIYHWLLHHAKYLGTYYTSVPAATLLLKLVMAAEWGRDFGDPAEMANFKVADLACGTGTLLMAAAQAFADDYIKTRSATGRPLEQTDLSILHRTLMENMLHGYDVLPSAVHLTASTLAMLAPEVAFVKMNLFVLPLGIDHGTARLGSLDFLSTNQIETQMALDYTHLKSMRIAASTSHPTNARVPKIDLCVMNPPFVRSVGGNLLFGSLPDERGGMQKELKKRVKKIGANVTVGLGSAFIALADKHLQPGGRLAFVTPLALASGEAWSASRALISTRYHLEKVVTSHDSERLYFSENCDISELLFIAKKLNQGEKAGKTEYISLWRNPRTIYEAIDLANRITAIPTVGTNVQTIGGVSGKLGEKLSLPAPTDDNNWTGALFAQFELLRIFSQVREGEVTVPGEAKRTVIPLCDMASLGALGPDRRRIYDGFTISNRDWSPYPAFWGHDSRRVRTIQQAPNGHLIVKELPKGPAYGPHLWERAGRILLVERLRPNTHRVIAVGFREKVLGNTWWALRTSTLKRDHVKALLLWLNSSLAVLLVYGARVITQGAWTQIKQPAWETMPVLDVRRLSSKQLAALATAYDALSKEDLQSLSQLHIDPVRRRIDNALAKILDLPSLCAVRELLAREPGLSAQEIQDDYKETEA